ncbi:MAG: HTH domain-containing protein, partial [Microbacterium sp.]|uniref:HTH domain-containing protein n=1 Tax=Microbacterium sp. TaxID=51671 RepID=UPI00262C9D2C
MLALLVRENDWLTAAALADALGVTPRSIRSYVTAVNARTAGAIESGPQGYRAGAEAGAALQAGADAATPRDRLHTVVRSLLDEPQGIDVFETADRLFVSAATIEADLSRVRGLLAGTELTLERSASRARLVGTEGATRR